jgi:antitoxin PrlF
VNVINLNARGTLTLPKELRQRLGLKDGGQVIAEVTDEGIMLRPGVTVPVEIYSDARIGEFERHNEKALAGFKLKKKK